MVSVYDMKVHDSAYYLAIGTHARSMYKLNLSAITSIDDPVAGQIGKTFQLKQNYPNPFNPTTTIPYSISRKSEVILSIYNTLGQEVRTLVNQQQPAGDYQVVWNGKDNGGNFVASGTYIYRLKAGDVTQTRRLTFLK
jgi:hypothetical protein